MRLSRKQAYDKLCRGLLFGFGYGFGGAFAYAKQVTMVKLVGSLFSTEAHRDS